MEELSLPSMSTGNASTPEWMSLPVEVWLEIFKHLSQPCILFIIRHVCRYFKSLIFDPSLWKRINLNEWKENATLKQLNLTSEETNRVTVEDGIDKLTKHLLQQTYLSSTEAFVPIVSQVSHCVQAISFSTYDGDLEFGEDQKMVLCQCHNLTYLSLAFCDTITSSDLKDICQNCLKLKTLVLEGCGNVSDCAMEHISKLRFLEKLDISHCSSVADSGLIYIATMPCMLKHFVSDGVLHLSDQGIIQLTCRQIKLETVVLDGENLSDLSVVLLARNLQNLTAFHVSFCSSLTDRSIIALTGFTSLKWLHLKKLGSHITTHAITHFFMERMLFLKHLALTDSESVKDSTLSAIANACPNLEHLELNWCCEVTDAGMQNVIKECSSLRQMLLVGLVRLNGDWLGDVDKYLPHLLFLDLSMCNTIRDEDLFQLVQRKHDLVAYSYFHELVDRNTVSDLILFHQISPSSANAVQQVDPECPGSMGATVDF